jgi:polyisoprenyl-teichoic acid--peptidoglycan teichoic acid transferase
LNPAGALGRNSERPSPTIAAFLSFLWPGLGHWYTRRDRAALLFALPVIGVVLIVAIQAAGGINELAALLLSPSSALTIAILIVLLGVWREIAVIDSASGIRPAGAWRRGRSLVVVILVSIIIAATHVWAASVAWAFYDAGNRIFVGGAEGPDTGPAAVTTSPGPGATQDLNDDYVAAPFATPPTASSRINVLLTGIDSAETRSHALNDTLMVASIDPVSHDVALISFPRDISNFPMVAGGIYHGKINSYMTYVTNHPKAFKDKPLVELVKELSFLVGAPIHYYAAVDLAGFRKLIDAAGGVTVNNEKPLNDPRYDWLDGRRGFKLSVGTHTLNGEDALAYVRSRYTLGDNDFRRARRQQEVLLALAHKFATPAMLPRLAQLINVAGDTVRTNFPSDRVSEMLDMVQGVNGAKVTQVVLDRPYSFSYYSQPGGIYTLELHMDKLAELSRKVFGVESTYASPSANPSPSAPAP